MLGGLTCDGLVFHSQGVNNSHPLSTTETGNKHELYVPHSVEKDFTFINMPLWCGEGFYFNQ